MSANDEMARQREQQISGESEHELRRARAEITYLRSELARVQTERDALVVLIERAVRE